jgi:hypothetical protein
MDDGKPSAGRMYDYFLGGNHNFEADRMAGDRVLKLMPFLAKYMRLQRWALQDIAIELTEKRGFDVIIDFASGLPTNDHIHHRTPAGTTILYSDFDPIIVEYARDILKEVPNTYFFHGDASRPEELLERPEVQSLLNGRRKVAIVIWGVSQFIADEGLRHAVQYLYDWAAPGSCLVFNAQGADVNLENPAALQIKKIYEQSGSKIHTRSREEYLELLKPWVPEEPGFISLMDWHGFDAHELGKEDIASFEPMGGGYGAYFTK